MEKYLWAKKNLVDGVPMWLPLTVHLNDTAEICGLLYEHWLSDGVKYFLEKAIISDVENKEDLLKNLCKFLGAVHDIGKATPIFQTKQSFCGDRELDNLINEKLRQAGFKEVDKYIAERKNNVLHNISGQYFLNKCFKVNLCVANIIGAHHGRPISQEQVMSACESFTSSLYQDDNEKSSLAMFWKEKQRGIFDWAMEACNFSCVEDLPLISQPGQVILSGLLIMADWIASNEKYFPLIPIDTDTVDPDRVEKGFTKWYRDRAETWEPESYCNDIYQKRFGFEPREVQKKVSDIISKIDNPGIVIMEAPMGIGKTETALVAVEELAKKTNRTGIFFGLPTQATSNGIFSRVEDWLKHCEGEKSIRLIHGKAQLNDQFANLPKSRNIHSEDSVGVNEWFAGRKVAILDDFTVGTVDQVLLAALKQKHLMLRHLGFANKVVVIDEVHAYDAYMSVYLYQALMWLGAYGVPVILLSATLPISKRNELLKQYMVGAGYRFKKLDKPQDFDNNENYPLLTYNDGEKINQFSDFSQECGTDYKVIPKAKDESENIVDLINELTTNVGIVGVILNTVKKSQKFAEQCVNAFGEKNVELLHSSFIATDRYKKEQELINTIGKNGKRPKFKIIIGTQVIEQSLDIDFDVLITDLAPMDLLLQRMGRLHRHSDTKRPENLKKPQVYILNCGNYDFDEASTYVYAKYLLFRTEYFLPNKVNLPNDISHLVQLVYSDNALNLSDDSLKKDYTTYQGKYNADIDKKEQQAEVYRLVKPLKKISQEKNLSDWIKNSNHSAELSDVNAYAQVRDSADSVEVIALKKCEGGYEFFDKSGKLDPTDNKTAMEIAKRTIQLSSATYYGIGIDEVIKELEKYYLKHFQDWNQQSWLKGSLAIIFDQNDEFSLLNKKILRYNNKYGLKVVTEDINERL